MGSVIDLGGKVGFPDGVRAIMPRVVDFSYLAEGRLNVKADCGSTNASGTACTAWRLRYGASLWKLPAMSPRP